MKSTEFYKNCKTCGKIQYYSSKISYYNAIKKDSECRSCATIKYAKKIGDASFLLEESLLKYYWLGFILADGHISNNRLSITLSIKDREHLLKLANLLKINKVIDINNNTFLASYFSLMDIKVFSILTSKYNIHSNKTTNPPNIYSITGDNLKALSIGFIDGDGNITNLSNRKDFNIRIKTHHSWLEVLKYMYGKAYLNKDNYAIACISNTMTSKNLKRFALKNNLPILNRKWDIIDLHFISKQELGNIRKEKVFNLLQLGYLQKNIAAVLNINNSSVSQIIKRNNLKTNK